MLDRFPLLDRELTRSAKRGSLLALRFSVLAIGVLALMFAGAGDAFEMMQAVSRNIIALCLVFQFTIAMVLPPFLMAGAIAGESEDRTLDLLLMADFRGTDVYFAKFAGGVVPTVTLILSALPLYAVSAFFGGSDVPRMAVVTVLAMVLALANGGITLFCSAKCETGSQALFLSFFFNILWLIVGFLIPILHLHPMRAAGAIAFGHGEMLSTVPALVTSLCVIAVSYAATVKLLFPMNKPAQLPKQTIEPSSARIPVSSARPRRYPELTEENLLPLLISAADGNREASLAMRIVAAVFLVFVALPCVGPFLVQAVIAYDLATTFRQFRRSGFAQDLLLTGRPMEGVAKAMFRYAVIKELIFILPLLFANVMIFLSIIMTQAIDSTASIETGLNWILFPVFAFLLVFLRYLVMVACSLMCARGEASPAISVVGALWFYGMITFVPDFVSLIAIGFSGSLSGLVAVLGMEILFFVGATYVLRYDIIVDAQKTGEV